MNEKKETKKMYTNKGLLSTEFSTWYEKPGVISKSTVRLIFGNGTERTDTREIRNIYDNHNRRTESYDTGIVTRTTKYYYNSAGLLSKIKISDSDNISKILFRYEHWK